MNLKNGLRNGLFKKYYRTGQLEFEGTYQDGFLEGVSKFYVINEKVFIYIETKKGYPTTMKMYDEQGASTQIEELIYFPILMKKVEEDE
jgi:antitoxin component YwqK of YwqJK toxin-antitoxin module